jgi:hypothetical protein
MIYKMLIVSLFYYFFQNILIKIYTKWLNEMKKHYTNMCPNSLSISLGLSELGQLIN